MQEEIRPGYGSEEIVGDSPALNRVLAFAKRVASSDAPVLITGEPGSGTPFSAMTSRIRCLPAGSRVYVSSAIAQLKAMRAGASRRRASRMRIIRGT